MASLEAALASLDAPRPRPMAKSTPEQMAAARAAAAAVVTHDGLRPGERLVAGKIYVCNADSRATALAVDASVAEALTSAMMAKLFPRWKGDATDPSIARAPKRGPTPTAAPALVLA